MRAMAMAMARARGEGDEGAPQRVAVVRLGAAALVVADAEEAQRDVGRRRGERDVACVSWLCGAATEEVVQRDGHPPPVAAVRLSRAISGRKAQGPVHVGEQTCLPNTKPAHKPPTAWTTTILRIQTKQTPGTRPATGERAKGEGVGQNRPLTTPSI